MRTRYGPTRVRSAIGRRQNDFSPVLRRPESWSVRGKLGRSRPRSVPRLENLVDDKFADPVPLILRLLSGLSVVRRSPWPC